MHLTPLKLRCQQGFTTITLMGVLAVGGLLLAAGFAAMDPDISLSREDQDYNSRTGRRVRTAVVPELFGDRQQLLHALHHRSARAGPWRDRAGEPEVEQQRHGPAGLAQPPWREPLVTPSSSCPRPVFTQCVPRQPVLDDRPERKHAPASGPGARAARREACWPRCDAATSSTSCTSPTTRRSTPPRTRTRVTAEANCARYRAGARGPRLHRDPLHRHGRPAGVRCIRTTTSSSAVLRSSGGRSATALDRASSCRYCGDASCASTPGRQGNA